MATGQPPSKVFGPKPGSLSGSDGAAAHGSDNANGGSPSLKQKSIASPRDGYAGITPSKRP